MNHRVRNLASGRKAVDDESSCLVLQNGDEIGEGCDVCIRSMQGRGKLAFKRMRQCDQLASIRVANDERAGAKDLLRQLAIAEKVAAAHLKERRENMPGAGF